MYKSKSNYTYEISVYKGINVISIQDQGGEFMSVTNNIENVVDDIAKLELIDPVKYKVIYRDSLGIWDGWDTKEQIFYWLGCRTEEDAKEKLKFG